MGGRIVKVIKMDLVGPCWVFCFRTHNEPTTFAPSVLIVSCGKSDSAVASTLPPSIVEVHVHT